MGTTRTDYYIMNTGFDRARLQSIMAESFKNRHAESSADDPFETMITAMQTAIGEDKLRQMWPEMEQARQRWKEEYVQQQAHLEAFGLSRSPKLPSPVVAYRPNAPWLPFFDRNICEGYNASSSDARRLSKIFGAPVLAFSIFDSDILMVSYSDAAKGVEYDYAKSNMEGTEEYDVEMEEYDTEIFKAEFPQFLTEFCPGTPEAALREIWDGDEVFADDRMEKLCQALGAVSFFCEELPEGFEAVTP